MLVLSPQQQGGSPVIDPLQQGPPPVGPLLQQSSTSQGLHHLEDLVWSWITDTWACRGPSQQVKGVLYFAFCYHRALLPCWGQEHFHTSETVVLFNSSSFFRQSLVWLLQPLWLVCQGNAISFWGVCAACPLARQRSVNLRWKIPMNEGQRNQSSFRYDPVIPTSASWQPRVNTSTFKSSITVLQKEQVHKFQETNYALLLLLVGSCWASFYFRGDLEKGLCHNKDKCVLVIRNYRERNDDTLLLKGFCTTWLYWNEHDRVQFKNQRR